MPAVIITPEGEQEYFVDEIIDEWWKGRGIQYLIRWHGYGPEEDLWLPGSSLKDNTALNVWLAGKGGR